MPTVQPRYRRAKTHSRIGAAVSVASVVAMLLGAGEARASRSMYLRQFIIIENGEFVATIERAARHRLNAYYKAKQCQAALRQKYYQGGKLDPAVARIPLRNHQTLAAGITIGAMDKALSGSRIGQLLKAYNDFMYAGPRSVSRCLADLMADSGTASTLRAPIRNEADRKRALLLMQNFTAQGRGFIKRRYMEVPACRALERQLFAPIDRRIEDYCNPIDVHQALP